MTVGGGGSWQRRAGAFVAAALLAGACSSAPAGPPEVHWGIDECTHCHMIVGEARYAAAARGPAGEEARFDDAGCLLRWRAEGHEAWQAWVHDADGEGWLAAAEAVYLHAPGRATPMGSGLTAHRDAAAAAAVAGAGAAGSAVLSWQEVQRFAAETPAP